MLRRHDAARDLLADALEVLRDPPDVDTVTALRHLAVLETFSGNLTDGQRLTTEALTLAQALGLPDRGLAGLFRVSGITANYDGRLAQAAAELREAARLAERAGDPGGIGSAQLNLADVLARSDPAAAADAARSAITHLRRTGQQVRLSAAVVNLAEALLQLGDWDRAATVLDEALAGDHLPGLALHALVGWLAGLRGDPAGAAAARQAVATYRTSQDPQDQAFLGLLDAGAALAAADPAAALVHATGVIAHHSELGIGSDTIRWAWPLATRIAHTLDDRAALGQLLATLDAQPAGHQAPILRAQRRLVAGLLADDPTAVADAVDALRRTANPYWLAHALIDHAELLARTGRPGADPLLDEATAIAQRLGCPPLLDRVTAAPTTATPA